MVFLAGMRLTGVSSITTAGAAGHALRPAAMRWMPLGVMRFMSTRTMPRVFRI